MRKNRQVRPIFENIRILDSAAEGKSICKIDEKIVFVPYTAPGDLIHLEITRSKKNYMEARMLELVQASPLREKPFCTHFGVCGGCKWQHLQYPEQLKQKQQQVIDQLERIGKLVLPQPQEEILASKNTIYYRNKLEYTFSSKRWFSPEEFANSDQYSEAQKLGLGFHLAGMFDKVLEINHCFLQPEPSNEIRNFIKQKSLELGYTFYNARSHEGFLRNIIIRNTTQHDFMLILIVNEDNIEKIQALLEPLKLAFPQITSLLYVINTKLNDSIHDLDVVCYHGDAFLNELMPAYTPNHPPLQFRIGPKSFYQTNADQAYELYKLAADFAQIQGHEHVYDLYTGTGTIANFIARSAKSVIGIEYVEDAVIDARVNSSINKIDNTVFYAGDMAKVLNPEFILKNGKPDVIITDPPREGMHPNVIEQILEISAQRIVYISCNAATQARDLSLLSPLYKITRTRSVDMFPHTYHVENVVLLEKI